MNRLAISKYQYLDFIWIKTQRLSLLTPDSKVFSLIPKPVHLGLIDKYDRTINRFRMGPIHYLIYNYTHSIPYLAAKDIAYLSNVT